MSKLFVRLSILYIAIYFLYVFYNALFLNIYRFSDSYVLLLELCLFLFTNASGKYHCVYIRWTALGILISDTITRLDNRFEFLPMNGWIYLPAIILSLSLLTTLFLAIRHYCRVLIIKYRRNEII